MSEELVALQRWFADQCDGSWEHQGGIEINTLDNPGWRVVTNLEGTARENTPFVAREENYQHDADWLRCWVEDLKFQAAGGPLTLSRILRIVLDWATANPGHIDNAV